MECSRRRRHRSRPGAGRAGGAAFTLIELLVVIAIIGILAAMLFPVFARARESARKTQCLANVKNIALAVQMYLTDWDYTPPWERRAEVVQWFRSYCDNEEEAQYHVTRLNPYLGWCLLLDDYVKNREVWRCPSAKLEAGATAINGYPDWFSHVVNTPDACTNLDPDNLQSYPPGWGGAVTDSLDQQQYAFDPSGRAIGGAGGAAGVFVQSIGITEPNRELSPSAVTDTARFAIASDVGFIGYGGLCAGEIAYPDLCGLGTCQWGERDWCEGTEVCRVVGAEPRRDHTKLKRGTRHLGGTNLGFLDGHAQWWPAEKILSQAPRYSGCGGGAIIYRDLDGILLSFPSTPGAGAGAGQADPNMISGGCYPLY